MSIYLGLCSVFINLFIYCLNRLTLFISNIIFNLLPYYIFIIVICYYIRVIRSTISKYIFTI